MGGGGFLLLLLVDASDPGDIVVWDVLFCVEFVNSDSEEYLRDDVFEVEEDAVVAVDSGEYSGDDVFEVGQDMVVVVDSGEMSGDLVMVPDVLDSGADADVVLVVEDVVEFSDVSGLDVGVPDVGFLDIGVGVLDAGALDSGFVFCDVQLCS